MFSRRLITRWGYDDPGGASGSSRGSGSCVTELQFDMVG